MNSFIAPYWAGKAEFKMRERTTWNRSEISKRASAMSRRAEDPRAMNQDHLQQQPAADAYDIGGPSEFAEDVAPNNWESEYEGGSTARDAIGLPEMRSDTFNHPEKTASYDEETLVKKADVCVKVARKMLGSSATESLVEDQAVALMNLSDADLISTANRLANQDEDEDDDEDEGQKQASDDDGDDEKESQDQEEKKQAGQVPPQFKENVEKKKEEAKEKKEKESQDQDDKKQSGKKKAYTFAQQAEQAVQSMQQGDQQGVQSAIQAMIQGMQQQAQQQGQQMQAQEIEQGIQQMVQQAMQQMQGQQQQQAQQQGQQQGQQAQQQGQQAQQQLEAIDAMDQQALDAMIQGQDQLVQEDDQVIDQMLSQEQGQQQMANDFGIQMESPPMDVGEVGLGQEDEVLATLFNANQEVQNAQHANALQGIGVQASQQPMTRTASTKTVGTRPTGGVSQLGGPGKSNPSGDIDKLANLWNSAPDVSDVFR